MKRILAAAVAAGTLAWTAGAAEDRATIVIDADKPGAEIPSSLYGIFYEEINHAGDGGLYAELIQNRSFEETVPIEGCTVVDGHCVGPASPNYSKGKPVNWRTKWAFPSPWPAWSLEAGGGLSATLETNATVHPRNPVYLRLTAAAGATGRLLNEGYWGIAAREGETYDLSFFARPAPGGAAPAKIRAGLLGSDGRVLGSAECAVGASKAWTKLTASFPSLGRDPKAKFFLQPLGAGTVDLDVVSLFPRATFKNRPGGLRADLAQMLVDLKPAFVRFPGGCVVEGATYANRYRWKETIGPVEGRPGHWSLWNYRNIDGLGFHEFLQFCEDSGAAGMFVCNVGLGCEFRNGDYLPEERLQEQIDDTLDALEYALGAADTKWGGERAKNGHPAPFPLTYVEIGNENHGPIYNRYYNKFHAALRAKWPKLVYIFNGGTSDVGPGREVEKVEMLDEHYYRDPDWFFANATRYDTAARDRGFTIYVGEYACNQGVGSGNLRAALSEAAFMIGMERNSDLVKLCSYAPLMFNVNDIKWPVNMIGYDSAVSFGRTSYHVQKLFGTHRPDVNLATTVRYAASTAATAAPYAGKVGLGAWNTKVEYRDLRVQTPEGVVKLDPADPAAGWTPIEGAWQAAAGGVRLDEAGEWKRGLFNARSFGGRYTIRLQARKLDGAEGFLVLFGGADGDHYRQVNFGGWRNAEHGLETIAAKKQSALGNRARGGIETDKWNEIEITVDGAQVEAKLNGKPVLKTGSDATRFQALAGLDRKAKELVVKVVNGEERPVTVAFEIRGTRVKPAGRRIELAGALGDENSVNEPAKIVPVESALEGAGPAFTLTLKPASFTLLRIPLAE